MTAYAICLITRNNDYVDWLHAFVLFRHSMSTKSIDHSSDLRSRLWFTLAKMACVKNTRLSSLMFTFYSLLFLWISSTKAEGRFLLMFQMKSLINIVRMIQSLRGCLRSLLLWLIFPQVLRFKTAFKQLLDLIGSKQAHK